MNRPRVRTENLPPELGQEILTLFGTHRNALRRLSLDLRDHTFYVALRGEPVTEEVADLIQDAWRSWKRQYLHGYLLGGRDPEDWSRLSLDRERDLLDRHPAAPARE